MARSSTWARLWPPGFAAAVMFFFIAARVTVAQEAQDDRAGTSYSGPKSGAHQERDRPVANGVVLPFGRALFLSPHEAAGDYDALARTWLEIVEAAPDSADAELALLRLREIIPRLAEPFVNVTPRLAAVLQKGVRWGSVRDRLQLLVAELYRAQGRHQQAAQLWAARGLILDWLLIGPFGSAKRAGHYRVYPPEREIDIERTYPGWPLARRWRPARRRAGARYVDVDAFPGTGAGLPARGVAYALAQVEIEKTIDAYLDLECSGPHKLWLNGRLVLDADSLRESLPTRSATPIRLPAGWNRILVKSTSLGPRFALRVLDADGLPLPKLVCETKLVMHPLPLERRVSWPNSGAPSPLSEGARAGTRAYFAAVIAAGPSADRLSPRQEALVNAALALLAGDVGLHDDALHWITRATQLSPHAAHFQYFRGRIIKAATHLDPDERMNRAREAFTAGVETSAGVFAPSLLELAELELRRGRITEAVARFKKTIEAAPAFHFARLRAAQVAAEHGWMNQARRWMEQLAKARPGWPPVHGFWADVYEKRRNLPKALLHARKLLERRPGDEIWQRRVAELLARRGRFKEAHRVFEQLLAINPDDPDLLRGRADLFSRERRFRDAIKDLQTVWALQPFDAVLARDIGDQFLRQGELDAALGWYDRALSLRPSWSTVRRLVDHLRGAPDDPAAAYRRDYRARLAPVASASDSRRYNTARLIDQLVVRLYRDGGYTLVHHWAERVLSAAGREQAGRIRVQGELLEAVTHTTDGRQLRPRIVPGQTELTMPGVSVGAIVEVRMREDHPAPDPFGRGHVRLPPRLFPPTEQPHAFCEYILIAPRALDLVVSTRNWRESPADADVSTGLRTFAPRNEGEEEDEDGGEGALRIYRWVGRGLSPPANEPEPRQAPRTLTAPTVNVATTRSWEDVADALWDRHLGRARPTRALRTAARRVVEGKRTRTVREKAAALYRFVGDHVLVDIGAGRTAHQILTTRTGDRNTLLLGLLRAADIEAQAAAVATTGAETEAADPLTAEDAFSRWIVCAFTEQGQPLWLDAGEPYAPAFALAPELHGARALVLGPRGGSFYRLPKQSPADHGRTYLMVLNVDAAGNAAGELSTWRFGVPGAKHQTRLLDLDEAGRERLAQESLAAPFPGVTLQAVKFPDLGRAGAAARMRCRFRVEGLIDLQATEKVCSTGLTPLPWLTEFAAVTRRRTPLQISTTRYIFVREEIRLHLDETLRVVRTPQGKMLQSPFGAYTLTVTPTRRGLIITRTCRLPPQVISPAQYPAFVRFCRAVDEADAQALVVE